MFFSYWIVKDILKIINYLIKRFLLPKMIILGLPSWPTR